MCRIKFEIKVDGYPRESLISAKGRWKKTTCENWREFDIDLDNPQTPNITKLGEYQLQVKVNNGIWSDWKTDIPNFFISENCGRINDVTPPIISGFEKGKMIKNNGDTYSPTITISNEEEDVKIYWETGCSKYIKVDDKTSKKPTFTFNNETESDVNCSITLKVCDSNDNCTTITKTITIKKKVVEDKCTDFETPIISYDEQTKKLSVQNKQEGVTYTWSYRNKSGCVFLSAGEEPTIMCREDVENCGEVTVIVHVMAEKTGCPPKRPSKTITINCGKKKMNNVDVSFNKNTNTIDVSNLPEGADVTYSIEDNECYKIDANTGKVSCKPKKTNWNCTRPVVTVTINAEGHEETTKQVTVGGIKCPETQDCLSLSNNVGYFRDVDRISNIIEIPIDNEDEPFQITLGGKPLMSYLKREDLLRDDDNLFTIMILEREFRKYFNYPDLKLSLLSNTLDDTIVLSFMDVNKTEPALTFEQMLEIGVEGKTLNRTVRTIMMQDWFTISKVENVKDCIFKPEEILEWEGKDVFNIDPKSVKNGDVYSPVIIGESVGTTYQWETDDKGTIIENPDSKNPTIKFKNNIPEDREVEIFVIITSPEGEEMIETKTITVKGLTPDDVFKFSTNKACLNNVTLYAGESMSIGLETIEGVNTRNDIQIIGSDTDLKASVLNDKIFIFNNLAQSAVDTNPNFNQIKFLTVRATYNNYTYDKEIPTINLYKIPKLFHVKVEGKFIELISKITGCNWNWNYEYPLEEVTTKESGEIKFSLRNKDFSSTPSLRYTREFDGCLVEGGIKGDRLSWLEPYIEEALRNEIK